MTEYKTYELGEVCSRLSSGKGIPASKVAPEGKYPVYGGNGLRGFTEQSNFSGDCAIIGRQGAFCGNVRYFSGEAYMTEHAVVVCATPEHNTRYLAYLLATMNLGRLSGQSAQPGLSVKTLAKQQISLPTLEIQSRVASVLAKLDEKIELNNQINENLQQQAQTLFKEWFIDNPENENWSNGTFSELIQSTLSGDWGKEVPVGNNTEKVYCVRGADIPEVKAGNKGKMPTRYILPKNYASKKLTAGDIVIEISGGSPTQSTGRCTAISESLLNRYDSGMVCTNFCRAIKPTPGYSMFIYYYWQYLYDKGVFFSYENGTTGIKNLDITGFLGTEPIIIPPKEKVSVFDEYCQAVFDLIFANGKESEQLALLRATLLPKLMSGEIDLTEIQF